MKFSTFLCIISINIFGNLGWIEPDRTEFEKIHNNLCDQDEWIIEGMSIRFFEYRIKKADMVIFLDVPTYLCLYRVFKRALTHFGTERFSSAKGCPERWPDLKFLKFIWGFRNKQRVQILDALHRYEDQKKIFIVKSKAKLSALIKKFESNVF